MSQASHTCVLTTWPHIKTFWHAIFHTSGAAVLSAGTQREIFPKAGFRMTLEGALRSVITNLHCQFESMRVAMGTRLGVSMTIFPGRFP